MRKNVVIGIVIAIICLLVLCATGRSETKVGGFAQGLWSVDVHSTSNSLGMKQAYVRVAGDNYCLWLNVSPGGDKLFSQYTWFTKIRAFQFIVRIPESKLSVGKFKPPASRGFAVAPYDQATVASSVGQNAFISRDFGVMWQFDNLVDSVMTLKIAVMNGEEAVNSALGVDSNSAKDLYLRSTMKVGRHVELGASGRYGKGSQFTSRIFGGDVFVSFPGWTFTLESFLVDQEDEVVTGYGLLTVEPRKNFVLMCQLEGIENRTTGSDIRYSTIGASYLWSPQKTKVTINYTDRSGDRPEPGMLAVQLQHVF